MSQHAIETCAESDGQWIPLTEYSVRSGISTSTIRRKIKSNSIEFKLENGRYLIRYEETPKPAPRMKALPAKAMPVIEAKKEEGVPRSATKNNLKTHMSESVLPLIDRSVKMASTAYENAIKEKDERIRLLEEQNQELRDRLSELRTLVQALEEKYAVRY